ncbi:FAD binding domain-containing protein [Candidatus Poriferisodalis sp.]|uniref:FAD binding domain-containing protein n=1 Tax=Candidatus Poriferisodalis sp. TaxID=3101277 RepID=UPI003B0148B8
MKPAQFSFVAPESLDAVVRALAEYGDDARILAGGQSLVPLMNLRLARPEVLVSINHCQELDYIALSNDRLVVGALVRQIDAETDSLVEAECPLLAKALPHVGLPATRNRGTVCGSLAHCDPLAELPAVALALEAELVLTSAAGERRVPAQDFFVAEMTTSIETGEVISAVTFRRQDPSERSALAEVSNGGHVFPVGGVALRWASVDGVCTMARIAAFGVGSAAQRLIDAEGALVGSDLGPGAIAAAVAAARGAVNPTGDIHADAEYRRHLVGVLVERGLLEGEGP